MEPAMSNEQEFLLGLDHSNKWLLLHQIILKHLLFIIVYQL